MPQELPGFYYDAEKNRYFPTRGPIPGSSRASSSASNAQKQPAKHAQQVPDLCRRSGMRTYELLQGRELNGNIINFCDGKFNFMEEFQKTLASQPAVWKYQGTEKIGDGALDQMHINLNTAEGQTEVEVLLTGGINGSLSLFEVGKVGQRFHNGINCIPDRVWPSKGENKAESFVSLGQIWRPGGASIQMPSTVSCIKLLQKHYPDAVSSSQHALITTLGSESSGGSVFVLNHVQPLDFFSHTLMRRMLREIAYFNCTIWTADYSPNANKAVIGTNLGAALVNLETGTSSWICRSKSDVLSQQLDQSGNVVLCGLRNGAIVTVDVRENQERYSARLIRHRIPFSHLHAQRRNSSKQWFEIKGRICSSSIIYMPSSVNSLVSLQSYDQYFLASSMDGTIKLYDHRMTRKGAVQTYEGLVNSHTRLQLGVDQSERFLIAGGEDCNIRLWSIKSGKLLFKEKVFDSVPTTISWQGANGFVRKPDECKSHQGSYGWNNRFGAWLGSQEGLFYMHWS